MNHYLDIRILPNPEISDCLLMNSLFSHLHIRLVKDADGQIGVSFPEVGKTLGSLLRLHGDYSFLQRLLSAPWMGGIKDHVSVSDIKVIPTTVSYRVIKRVQTKSSSDRLYRRSVRKGWLTEEEAALKINNAKDKKLSLPYVRMKSLSTGQLFLFFIEHGPIISNPISGRFNSYGLSDIATIPWF